MRRFSVLVAMFGLCTTVAVAPSHPSVSSASPGRHVRSGAIVFMRPGTADGYDLWVVRPDGRRLRQLTTAPTGRSDYNPDWSPDGSTVLFERRVLDDSGLADNLYTVGSDGTSLRQITDCTGDCWADNEATWSRDGQRIALDRAVGPRALGHPLTAAIFVMNADATHDRQLSTPGPSQEDHYPTWSPDGKTIVFMRNDYANADAPTALIAADVRTGHVRVVYSFPSWAPGAGVPKYSPNGKQILFTYWCSIYGDGCPPGTRTARNDRLATIRPDGTGLHVLPLPVLADSGTWSPDGHHLAFRCQPEPDVYRLCTSDLGGRHLTTFPWPVLSAHPDWAASRSGRMAQP